MEGVLKASRSCASAAEAAALWGLFAMSCSNLRYRSLWPAICVTMTYNIHSRSEGVLTVFAPMV